MYIYIYIYIYIYVSNSDIIKIIFFVRPVCQCFSSELILFAQKIVVATEVYVFSVQLLASGKMQLV